MGAGMMRCLDLQSCNKRQYDAVLYNDSSRGK